MTKRRFDLGRKSLSPSKSSSRNQVDPKGKRPSTSLSVAEEQELPVDQNEENRDNLQLNPQDNPDRNRDGSEEDSGNEDEVDDAQDKQAIKVSIITPLNKHVMVEECSYENVLKLGNYITQQRQSGVDVIGWNCIAHNAQMYLNVSNPEVQWKKLDNEDLIAELFKLYPEKTGIYRENITIRAQQIEPDWNESNTDIQKYAFKLFNLWKEYDIEVDAESEQITIKELIKSIGKSKNLFHKRVSQVMGTGEPEFSLQGFLKKLTDVLTEYKRTRESFEFFTPFLLAKPGNNQNNPTGNSGNNANHNKAYNNTNNKGGNPKGKGGQNDTKVVKCSYCHEKGHWYSTCPKKKEGTTSVLINKITPAIKLSKNNLIYLNILLIKGTSGGNTSVITKAMLDSGATQSLMSRRVADIFNLLLDNNSDLICFANNSCISCSKHKFKFNIKLSSNVNNLNHINAIKLDTITLDIVDKSTDILEVEFKILPDMTDDIILSREVIFKNNLTELFAELFSEAAAEREGNVGKVEIPPEVGLGKVEIPPEHLRDDDDVDMDFLNYLNLEMANPEPEPTRPLLQMAEGMDDDFLDEFDTFEAFPEIEEPIRDFTSFDIRNDGILRGQLIPLLMNNRDLFRSDVKRTPMRGNKFFTKVNKEEWLTNANRLPPRIQSYKKDQDLNEQLDKLLNLGVIRPSASKAWSQVHLVPKGDKYRLCLDFRNLNSVSEDHHWPIPRIDEMLIRLGQKKSKFWSKLDLTSGYHQCEIDEEFKEFTAFITFRGLYEWNRLPMGLKGAGHHFQQIVSVEVLAGLIYKACDQYFDDVIIPGATEQEHMDNLSRVLKNLRESGVTLNPKKCVFGASEIEFCGHLLTEEGTHFSGEKLKYIEDFPEPGSKGALKSFLGLANYFRDHVKNYAHFESLLNELLPGYTKKHRGHKLQWTGSTKTAFESLKSEILNSPMLFFMEEKLPIYLATDASDFAIGGYLYQVKQDKELPVRFLSKSLVGSQLRWSTFDKEGYAMYYSIMTFKYLLEGRRFIVRTDHDNITKLNNKASARVLRWKISLCPFDFVIQHIRGIDNVVPDHFSRIESLDKNQGKNTNEAFVEYVNITSVEGDKSSMIARAHGGLVGHSGVNRTLWILKEKLNISWKGMRQDVRKYIASCSTCQLLGTKADNYKGQSYHVTPAGPMDIITMDHIGPMKFDKDNSINMTYTHVLVIVDCFTKWTSLYAVVDTKAESAMEALFNFTCNMGEPVTIMSDNGPAFCSEVMGLFLRRWGIVHKPTTAYNHEENGIVERANREVIRHLRAILLDGQVNIENDWAKQLPFVGRIMNNHIHKSTGFTPFSLVYGRESNTFIDRKITELERGYKINPSTEWIRNKFERQHKIINLARNHLAEINKIPESKLLEQLEAPTPGEWVLVRRSDIMNNHKLAPVKEGPFRVIERDLNSECPDIYWIDDHVNGRNFKVHVSRLTKFLARDSDLKQIPHIAMKRKRMYEVEYILNHKNGDLNNIKTKNDILFLVKWTNYNHEDNTWESFSNLENNSVLHDYLRENNADDWIPKRFR